MNDQYARAEAERRYRERYASTLAPSAVRNARMIAFEEGAEWARAQVLAEVREGIGVLTADWVVEDVAALMAVLDRAAGRDPESADTEAGR